MLMETEHGNSTEGAARDLVLVIESARAIVAQLKGMSESLDAHLEKSADLDMIISLLAEKKGKVETLMDVVRDIKSRLKVDRNGSAGVLVPEDIKARYADLMKDFRDLLDREARIESLVCGRGLPITKAGE
jgi:PHD/YefM family antitoxin component YafN of YafNO toxin-antitoxin module